MPTGFHQGVAATLALPKSFDSVESVSASTSLQVRQYFPETWLWESIDAGYEYL